MTIGNTPFAFPATPTACIQAIQDLLTPVPFDMTLHVSMPLILAILAWHWLRQQTPMPQPVKAKRRGR